MLHHHHHHQVQIIATVVRLEAIGAVFGVIGFGVGCYLFVVVWSFRFEDDSMIDDDGCFCLAFAVDSVHTIRQNGPLSSERHFQKCFLFLFLMLM